MASPSAALYNTDFQHAIARNKRNTVVLFVVLLAIGAAAGYVLGWGVAILELIWNLPAEEVERLTAATVLLDLFGPPRPDALAGAAILSGSGLVWGLITLASGENILASFAGARPADLENPVERQFIDVVEEMAIAAGVPPPRPMVIDTSALNAFASGYSPQRAMITATSGILSLCTREELQGVIGHEMGHVADYDVRYTTVVAAMAGVLVLLAHFLGDVLQWTFGWGGVMPYRSRGRDSEGASGVRIALTLVVLVLLAIVLVVAPLAARIVQMAISRQREYLADASSAKLTRNPIGLIHALERLARSDTDIARKNSPVAALCIAEPKNESFSGLLSTHPPIPDRIARLRNLGGAAIGGEASEPPSVEPSRHENSHGGPWGPSAETQAAPAAEPPSAANKGPWG
jgi:heat shock protein HtpX